MLGVRSTRVSQRAKWGNVVEYRSAAIPKLVGQNAAIEEEDYASVPHFASVTHGFLPEAIALSLRKPSD